MKRTTRHGYTILVLAILSLSLLSLGCSTSTNQVNDSTPAQLRAQERDRAQALFVHANEALDSGHWEVAIARYDDALQLHQRWDIHMNRGLALMQLNQFRDATAAFADALAHGGDQEPILYFNLGNLYQERGLYEQAIAAYRTSLAYRGELDYETLLNIGASYIFLHVYEQARETIEAAIDIAPDRPEGYLSFGVVLFAQEQPDEALRTYDQLIGSFPAYAPAHFNRGFMLMRTGESEQALASFQTYLDLDPGGPYAQAAHSNIDIIQRRR